MRNSMCLFCHYSTNRIDNNVAACYSRVRTRLSGANPWAM
nr:MAG TPA: hypothetical protein [Caudoviricetes sp.]